MRRRPLIWNLQDPEFYDEREDEQERPKHKFIGTLIDKSYPLSFGMSLMPGQEYIFIPANND